MIKALLFNDHFQRFLDSTEFKDYLQVVEENSKIKKKKRTMFQKLTRQPKNLEVEGIKKNARLTQSAYTPITVQETKLKDFEVAPIDSHKFPKQRQTVRKSESTKPGLGKRLTKDDSFVVRHSPNSPSVLRKSSSFIDL